ncbi:MAG TPA: hypothetical protein VGM31_00580 [Puia sp.]|jgi:hypothetical protein
MAIRVRNALTFSLSFHYIIALPLAWWIMDGWLHSFAYRVDMGPAIFIIAGGSVILISLCTIGIQSVRAALASPVTQIQSTL